MNRFAIIVALLLASTAQANNRQNVGVITAGQDNTGTAYSSTYLELSVGVAGTATGGTLNLQITDAHSNLANFSVPCNATAPSLISINSVTGFHAGDLLQLSEQSNSCTPSVTGTGPYISTIQAFGTY